MNNEQLLQIMAMMNPEMAPVLGLLRESLGSDQQTVEKKRKPSAYNRRYAAAYRRIKKKKTLKNGRMAKGFGGRSGHKRIVKMAHAEAKKGGRKR